MTEICACVPEIGSAYVSLIACAVAQVPAQRPGEPRQPQGAGERHLPRRDLDALGPPRPPPAVM
jgi:hypothetical protein|eukprot:COSAG01_NODE_3409_length_6127_cov_19.096384_9_plen_64_part_00